MIDLTKIDQVKALQSNLRASLETAPGKEVMKFIEQISGWYDFAQTDPNQILVGHGKRQICATLKTLIEKKPEEIVAIAKGMDNA